MSGEARVVTVDPLQDSRWDAYVRAHPDGSSFHLSGWLRALHAEYGRPVVGLLAEDGHGAATGVLPLMWTQGMRLPGRTLLAPRLASLPRTPVAGALADADAVAEGLLERAIALAAARPGARLQVKAGPGTPAGPLAAHPWRETFVVPLPPAPEDVRFGNSRNHSRIRWAVNKARKAGIAVRLAEGLDEVRAWYPLHLEALRIHGVPPRPRRFFEALWESLGPEGVMRLYLAEDPQRRLLAGSVVLSFGSTAFYAFNGVRRSALGLRPNDVIQWEAIHDAVRDGRRRYDLGEVVEHHEGLADFKRKWGADPTRLVRLYHPAPAAAPDPGAGGAQRAVEAVWKRLPLRLTAALGNVAYRFL